MDGMRPATQQKRDIVDLDLGNGRVLRAEVFVTNVFDTVYMTTLINTPGLNLRFFNPPRQAGVRLRAYF